MTLVVDLARDVEGAVAKGRSTRDMCTKEGMSFFDWCERFDVRDPDRIAMYMPAECNKSYEYGEAPTSCCALPPPPTSSSPLPLSLVDDYGGYVIDMNTADAWF